MLRKPSKSSLSSKLTANQPWPLAPLANQSLPPPRHQLQRASDSNLSASKNKQRDNANADGQPGETNDARARRTTIATSGQRQSAPAVWSTKPKAAATAPANAKIGSKIVEYMPELYEEVDPIRIQGNFYTWEDPARLDYVPLPPPPRKNVKCGRVVSKPKNGPDVCSSCSSKRSFSCGSSQCEPKMLSPPQ